MKLNNSTSRMQTSDHNIRVQYFDSSNSKSCINSPHGLDHPVHTQPSNSANFYLKPCASQFQTSSKAFANAMNALQMKVKSLENHQLMIKEEYGKKIENTKFKCHEQIENLQRQLDVAQLDNKQLSQELDKINKQSQTQTETLKKYEQQVKELQDHLLSQNLTNSTQIKDLFAKLEFYMQENQTITQLNEKIKQELDKCMIAQTKGKKTIELMTIEIKKKDNYIHEIDQELKTARLQLQLIKSEGKKHKNKLQEKEKEILELQNLIKIENKSNQEKHALIRNLENQLDQHIEQSNRLQFEREQLYNDLQQSNQNLIKIQEENDKKNVEIQSQKQTIELMMQLQKSGQPSPKVNNNQNSHQQSQMMAKDSRGEHTTNSQIQDQQRLIQELNIKYELLIQQSKKEIDLKNKSIIRTQLIQLANDIKIANEHLYQMQKL